MKRALPLLCSLAITGPAAAADTKPAEKLAVVLMDDARMGQVRYLTLLLDGLNMASAESERDGCLTRSITAQDAETCIRARSNSPSPREPLLILKDAASADPKRPGLASLVCVGPGARASDAERQSITLWPRAYGLQSATPFTEDNRRLRDCLAAAQAEAVP